MYPSFSFLQSVPIRVRLLIQEEETTFHSDPCLGVMRIIVFVGGLLLLTLSSCKKEVANGPAVVYSRSFLALGDSYTIGQGVQTSERWPVQLQERLIALGLSVDSLNIIAQTGWTTANLQNAIDQQVLVGYDMVSLLIGVNNQFQGLSIEQFQQEFDSLLAQAIDFANGSENVFVVSIPDYGVTPFGASNSEFIAQEIDAYNAVISDRCASEGVPFLDVTTISRVLGSSSGALAADNLHPSGYQYQLWTEEILPIALGILQD